MERRGFLKGLLLSTSASAGTALVKLATPGEVQALVPQRNVMMAQPTIAHEAPFPWADFAPECYMRRKDGRFVPVGVVTSLTVNAPVDECRFLDGTVILTQRPSRAEMEFKGWLGGTTTEQT